MPKLLSERAVEQYHRDGYYHPVRVFTSAQMSGLRAQLEALEARLGAPLHTLYRKPHLLFPFLADIIRHPTILDAVEDVLGPNLLCWNANFFTKEASSGDYVSWHQDATYWGLEPADVTTVWLAFSDSNTANGAMCVVPGSHREQLAHADTFAELNQLSRGQEVQVDVDESEAVELTLEAGQASLHHVLIIHGSGPNPTADRRIGLAIRYLPAHVRQVVGPGDSATLVRGEYSGEGFELEPRPRGELEPEMVALHDRLAARMEKVLYRGTHVVGEGDEPRPPAG